MYNKKQENKLQSSCPYIFTNKINTNYKLIPFNKNGDVGETRYLPASSKE